MASNVEKGWGVPGSVADCGSADIAEEVRREDRQGAFGCWIGDSIDLNLYMATHTGKAYRDWQLSACLVSLVEVKHKPKLQ